MRLQAFMTVLAIPLTLAACGSGNEDAAEPAIRPKAENMPMKTDMPMMKSGEQGQTARAEGRVTAIDEVAGTITIDHGTVAAVNWPAMTMAFKADEAARENVTVADEVSFEFRTIEGGTEIVSVRRK